MKTKKCKCNVCRFQRGEISAKKALRIESRYARKLEKLIKTGHGDRWACEANLDFSQMFIEDLKKKIKENA